MDPVLDVVDDLDGHTASHASTIRITHHTPLECRLPNNWHTGHSLRFVSVHKLFLWLTDVASCYGRVVFRYSNIRMQATYFADLNFMKMVFVSSFSFLSDLSHRSWVNGATRWG